MDCLSQADQIAAELAVVDVSGFLTETGQPYTYTIVRDAEGGRTETWVATASTIATSVDQIKPSEPVRQGERKQDVTMTFKLTTAGTVLLGTKDRVVIASGASAGTYEVMGPMKKASLSFLNAYWCVLVAGF